ncbi:MAG TPA: hypothetical protein VN776_05400 [Terracidiphilus sp.]|nr:hypothetical protein [Terracidiphilus sp.]
MKNPLVRRLGFCLLLTLLLCACPLCALPPSAPAQSIPVRYLQGTVHGFLVLKSDDGKILASGDSIQTVRGNQVTAHTLFSFKDGSIDDETTVFSQRGVYRLITNHHLQKGPSFPHPMDVLIDARSRQVTVRSTGKDGKEEVKTDHLDLPPDLANGMVPLVIENIRSGVAETTVPMLVTTPKPRLVKLVISPRGEESFSVVGSSRKAIHYEIKIEIGGLEGMVAPLVGKAPPNIDLWIIGGQAPTFLREQGPLYEDGPIMTIELASPVWPDSPKAGS